MHKINAYIIIEREYISVKYCMWVDKGCSSTWVTSCPFDYSFYLQRR
jgi:hypothetical protein